MSSSKHFINDPTHLVVSALHSITHLNPSVALDVPNKIIYRRPTPESVVPPLPASPKDATAASASLDPPVPHDPAQPTQKVALMSGGGSGHEPSFSSLVGAGMLSAAVAGTIFASPSTAQVATAINARVPRDQDVCVVVMNYTGDVLNFGVAVEKAKAARGNERGVEMVVVGDDVGVGRAKAGKVGRRGIAGTVLVVKIAGALAARGFALENVVKCAKAVAGNLVSVGASLERVHVPGREKGVAAEDEVGEGMVELGMGIHNESGSGRIKLTRLEDLVGEMLRQLLDLNDKDRAFVDVSSPEVVLLVNNLGSVSELEMGGIVDEVVRQLEGRYGIRPVRILAGTYMTSLNGLGFSITLLNVVDMHIQGAPDMIQLLDDPAEAAGWSAPVRRETWDNRNLATMEEVSGAEKVEDIKGDLKMDPKTTTVALTRGLEKVIAAEPEVTRYDTVVGDGDCGIGLKRGAEAILAHLKSKPLTGDTVRDVASIVPVVESSMDGTSGALYTIFLHSLVNYLRKASPGEATPGVWAAALKQSMTALETYTPAKPGDRTLVDALEPFVQVLGETADVKKAAEAAVKGAEETKGMKASLGRSVYVGGKGFEQVPDPGAWGLSCFFGGLAGM